VRDGKNVEENAPIDRPVLDPNDDAILTDMLQNVVQDGTGQRAAISGRAVAGKTGTTENYGDAWFVGYTPQLAVAVWVGYPKRLIPMAHEFEGGPVAGGTFPALIFKTFTEGALRYLNEPPESFPLPEYHSATPVQVTYRGDKWLVDNGNCRFSRQVLYVVGYAPEKQADCKPNEVDVPDVVGLTVEAAQARLASMPLRAEVISRPAAPGEKLGIVLDQYPKRGKTLSSWQTVRIVTAESAEGPIPRLVGLRVSRAEEILAAMGLKSVIEAAAGGTPGIVLAQEPRPGRAAVRGMKVTLRVARG